ncbi:XrtA-associated tyrosine autokinase [Motilimonas pumila]|uniref:non-specific protein-tyrosine kinase n=1 Tax=Motilimonas pumila TaxID=2303987 RepID=A0A418YHA6_9GAMM|nr:XrtA-associated tyrosine autokinase [Motilimonas pumila]RJG49468.1 polysaccharide biosynthesis tyrosine autokinase [Motilimonas pumila]
MSIIEKALAKKQQQPTQSLPERATEKLAEKGSQTTIGTTNKASQKGDAIPVQNSTNTTTPSPEASKSSLEKDVPSPEKIVKNDFPDSTNDKVLKLNIEGLKQRGFLVDPNERSQLHEEFRFVKRRILKTAFGPLNDTLEHSNLILVTSSRTNEGKTYNAINLALSIAMEQDKTVLLIDADVLKPSICKELEVEAEVGLVDYLLGQTSDLQGIIYNTNVPNLRIIPAGARHHLTSELLASTKMAEMTKELANRYSDRIILFDAPPLLGINETQALTSLVGQQILVVEENKTQLSSLENAISLLNKDRAIGLVLNKTVQHRNLYGQYGYQYVEY